MKKERYFNIKNCYDYLVASKDIEVIAELKEEMKNPLMRINWCNFESGNIYYNNNCERYNMKVYHHINMVVLEKLA